MESKKLEALLMAVDLGSFTKAAEVMGYTQSGLTHLVNSLEREIGFPLIIRSHNGIALTEEGRELAYGTILCQASLCENGGRGGDNMGRVFGKTAEISRN